MYKLESECQRCGGKNLYLYEPGGPMNYKLPDDLFSKSAADKGGKKPNWPEHAYVNMRHEFKPAGISEATKFVNAMEHKAESEEMFEARKLLWSPTPYLDEFLKKLQSKSIKNQNMDDVSLDQGLKLQKAISIQKNFIKELKKAKIDGVNRVDLTHGCCETNVKHDGISESGMAQITNLCIKLAEDKLAKLEREFKALK